MLLIWDHQWHNNWLASETANCIKIQAYMKRMNIEKQQQQNMRQMLLLKVWSINTIVNLEEWNSHPNQFQNNAHLFLLKMNEVLEKSVENSANTEIWKLFQKPMSYFMIFSYDERKNTHTHTINTRTFPNISSRFVFDSKKKNWLKNKMSVDSIFLFVCYGWNRRNGPNSRWEIGSTLYEMRNIVIIKRSENACICVVWKMWNVT